MRINSWKILRADLTRKKIDDEEIGIETLRLFMGGSGTGAKILYDETSAVTNPLGPENMLIFMTGIFTGSMVPSSGGHSVIAKSPLTGIYGECDIGGSWRAPLKRAGYDGIVITGISEEPFIYY
jgi:aldehyde:ferredoxin oxidoreductase